MEVYLAKMAVKGYFRTLKHAPFQSEQLATPIVSRISHRNWIKNLITSQGLGYLESTLDEVPLHRRWDRRFQVDISSMLPHNPCRGFPSTAGLNIYTDGSKDKEQTGAGVVILDNGEVLEVEGEELAHSYHLGRKTTVFQSEIFALKMAATLIINGSFGARGWVNNRPITIHSDSQASILALNNVWVKSLLVKQTIDLMDQAAGRCPSLTIRWVKAHVGHDGNELADQKARDGRDDSVAPDWETPLLARAVMHKEIDNMATRLWESTWNEVIGCRQTRHFFPTGPRPGFYKDIINLPRIIVGQLIQILTGHTYLKRHQAVIDESGRQRVLEALNYENFDADGNAIIDAADPKCDRCHGGGDETPLHLLSECDALGDLRRRIFGREDLVGPGEIPDFSNLKVYQILSFFREAKFETLTMHPFLAQYLPTDKPGNEDNQEMIDSRRDGFNKGQAWTSKYLFHLKPPKKKPLRKKKDDEPEEPEDSGNQEEEEGSLDGETALADLNYPSNLV